MLRIGPAIIPSTIGMVTASRGNARRQRSRIARRVAKALDALGGLESPAGSCVRHVVGLQRLIREWAMRQGWGGRPVRVEQAQGILMAALGVLAGYYGYEAHVAARRTEKELS